MSINCNDVDMLLDRRLKGARGDEEAQEVLDHVGQCPRCRALVTAEDTIIDALITMPAVACPPRVVAAIKAATVHQTERQKSLMHPTGWPLFRWKPAWVGMAAAFACVALILVSRVQKSDVVPFENDPGTVETASAVVRWSLVFTAQTLQTSQSRVVRQTIAGDVPRRVYSAMSRVPLLKGVLL